MLRFLLAVAYPALLLPPLFGWARGEIAGRIRQMQQAAFDTPGAAAPLPPQVLVVGVGALLGHLLWGRLLGLHPALRWLALLLGTGIGTARILQPPRTHQ